MKCLTKSWLRRTKRSASVSLPFGPSKTYSFSTLTQGSARRSAASRSRSRVSSFSFASSALRAVSQSSRETISFGRMFILLSRSRMRGRRSRGLWVLASASGASSRRAVSRGSRRTRSRSRPRPPAPRWRCRGDTWWDPALPRPLAVHHPRDAEAIDEHAEAHGPERLLQRHRHRAVLGERLEDALRLRRLGDADRHGEALRCFIPL